MDRPKYPYLFNSRLHRLDDLLDTVASLRNLLTEQHDTERHLPTKSTYLQALVQCLLSIRAVSNRLSSPAHQSISTGGQSISTPPRINHPSTSSWQWYADEANIPIIKIDGPVVTNMSSQEKQVVLVRVQDPLVPETIQSWDNYLLQCGGEAFTSPSCMIAFGLSLSSNHQQSGDDKCPLPIGLWVTNDRIWANLPGSKEALSAKLPYSIMQERDVLTLIYDGKAQTLEIRRNTILLGLMIGPLGSNAYLEWDSDLLLEEEAGRLYPAVVLMSPQDKVSIRPRPVTSLSDMEGNNQVLELLRAPLTISNASYSPSSSTTSSSSPLRLGNLMDRLFSKASKEGK